MSNALLGLGEISGETVFIDGTKIEAAANKYTFVWKKAVTKNQTKLLVKLADFVAQCEQSLKPSEIICPDSKNITIKYISVADTTVIPRQTTMPLL